MEIHITIDLENAAFEEDRGLEVYHIIRTQVAPLARLFADGPATSSNLMDSNGNTVGKVDFR